MIVWIFTYINQIWPSNLLSMDMNFTVCGIIDFILFLNS